MDFLKILKIFFRLKKEEIVLGIKNIFSNTNLISNIKYSIIGILNFVLLLLFVGLLHYIISPNSIEKIYNFKQMHGVFIRLLSVGFVDVSVLFIVVVVLCLVGCVLYIIFGIIIEFVLFIKSNWVKAKEEYLRRKN